MYMLVNVPTVPWMVENELRQRNINMMIFAADKKRNLTCVCVAKRSKRIQKEKYSFSQNPRSGKWLYVKGNYYWRYSHFSLPWLWENGKNWEISDRHNSGVSPTSHKEPGWDENNSSGFLSTFTDDMLFMSLVLICSSFSRVSMVIHCSFAHLLQVQLEILPVNVMLWKICSIHKNATNHIF